MTFILKTVLGLMKGFFSYFYLPDIFKYGKEFSDKPWAGLSATGFITNFFDARGIGSFAQQTAILKFFGLVDDRFISGTMNVASTIPTVTQAFIFMTAVKVEPITLASMSMAAPVGAILGAGVVARMSRKDKRFGFSAGAAE